MPENPGSPEVSKAPKIDLKQEFLSSFVKEQLQANTKNAFLDEIEGKDSLSDTTTIETSLKSFKAWNDKFSSFELKNINIFDLKRYISKDYLKLNNSRQKYLEKVLLDYEITDSAKKVIEKSIKNKSELELAKLVNSDRDNRAFLESKLSGTLTKKDAFDVLSKLNSETAKFRLKSLGSSKKYQVESILWNIASTWKIKDADLRILFETWFFSHAEKREFIKTYIPFIDLKRAVDINLYTDLEAQKYKKEILWKELKKWNSFFSKNDLTDKQKDEIISSASLSDISISTKTFLWSESNLDVLADKIGFANFEKDFENNLDEAKKGQLKWWPQSLESLKQILENNDKNHNKIQNISKFIKWNVLKVSVTDEKSWKIETSFLEIINTDDTKKSFSYRIIGYNDEIIQNSNSEIKNNTYIEFAESFEKNKNISLDIQTKKEINDNVKSGVLKSKLNIFSHIWEDWLKTEIEELNKEIKEKKVELKTRNKSDDTKNIVESIEKEINDLEVEKKKLEKEEVKVNKSWNLDEKSRITSEIEEIDKSIKNKEESLKKYFDLEEDPEYKEILDKITEKQDQLDNLDEYNFKNLLKVLDENDPKWSEILASDGRKGLFKGMYIETKKWIFEITWIDRESWEIILRNPVGLVQNLDFFSFSEAFKQEKAKRIKPIDNMESLLSDLSWEDDLWKEHEIKNWKLIAKKVQVWGEEKDMEVDYLVSKDNELIKIVSSWNWQITIQFWEKKDLWDLNPNNKEDKKILSKVKKDKNWEYKWELVSLDDRKHTYTLTEFKKLISNNWDSFTPDWQIWKEKIISDPKENNDGNFHNSFVSKFFNNFSFAELYSGWKLMLDSITESLKKGNDVHSAKVALSFWKFLPDEIRADLQAKVDGSESEAMDKELKELWKVESGDAINRIKKWLYNKDTPEYKKEAWMLFMLSKYWTLNAKWPLASERWKWSWYKAFGWKVNDELFLKIQKEAADDGVGFTEEVLMYRLLTDQCKVHKYSNIKRRWRLYKEFEWKNKAWISDELEKWHKEAESMRQFSSRNKWAISESMWGEFNNWLWKYKSAVWRWWEFHEMNEYPFIVAFSWAWYWLQEAQLNEFKGYINTYWGLIFTRFMADISWMELLNDTVVELSKRYEEIDPIRFKWIYERAKTIKLNQKNWSISEKSKMQDAQSFWKDFWKPLTRSMHFLNNQNREYEQTDKIILLEEGNNDVFKRYKTKVWQIVEEGSFSDKWVMDDQWWEMWWTWLWWKVFSQIGWIDQQWKFANWPAAKKSWREVVWELTQTNNKILVWNDLNSVKNRQSQRFIIQKTLLWLLQYISERGWQKNIMSLFKDWLWDVWNQLQKMWISEHIDEIKRISGDEFKAWTMESKIILNKITDKLMSNDYSSNNIDDDSDGISTSNLKKDVLAESQEEIKDYVDELVPNTTVWSRKRNNDDDDDDWFFEDAY